MHPYSRAERGLNVAVSDETDLGIEGASVRVRCHLDPVGTPAASSVGDFLNKRPADSQPHPIRIDKQVIELDGACGRKPGGEPDDDPIADRRQDAPFRHRDVGQLQDVGMGEQLRPIALVRERRPAKDVAQYGQVGRSGVADEEGRHEVSIAGVDRPASESLLFCD